MTLAEALDTVLACPCCRGTLDRVPSGIVCRSCGESFAVVDGIPVLMRGGPPAQETEQQVRDAVAGSVIAGGESDRAVMTIVSQHHCVPVMLARAAAFRSQFQSSTCLIDIGVGWGWHWAGSGQAPAVIGIDMSLGSLRVARRLLSEADNVLLVCADAAALPIRDHRIAGVWSVQAFQHFPDELMIDVQRELDRVLAPQFRLEIYNLNPAPLQRLVYRLAGKRFHLHGRLGDMVLNRFSGPELLKRWRTSERPGATISYEFSELFFHPNFRLRPSSYPSRLEQLCIDWFPRTSGWIARQVQVRVTAE